MALILELRDANGTVSRHRLTGPSLTIGRGLSSDVLLDDPYVDAHHARIRVAEDGALVLDDLGSTNGIRIGDARVLSVAVEAGTTLRIGRTTLLFRDVDETMAPALADDAPATVTCPLLLPPPTRSAGWFERQERRLERLATTGKGQLSVMGVLVIVVGITAWCGAIEKSVSSTVMGALLASALVMLVWSAVWAIATRRPDRRANLFAHYAVVAIGVIVMFVGNTVNEWTAFLFPSSEMGPFLFTVITLGVVVSLVAGHLSVANIATRRARWRAGAITAAMSFAILMTIAVLANDKGTDAPTFPHDLEPLPASLVPSMAIDTFGDGLEKVKKEVDDMAEKNATGTK